eukprot:XP_017951211.1 PREDICTED: uncharacterized protein LOC101731891 [Xenopus tropicalis]
MNSNSSLIISPVERTDNGSFTCTASNSVNSETSSPLTLNLGWSPDGNVQCNAVSSGQAVTLSCSWPGGNPAANVTLIFQNQIYTAQDTLALDILLGTFSSGAELACLGTQEGQITVSTMILGSSSSQLSPGAIAGIVITALFVVALIPLTVIFILRKTNNNSALVSTKTLSFDNTPTVPTYENAETPAANNATYDCVIITSEISIEGDYLYPMYFYNKAFQ